MSGPIFVIWKSEFTIAKSNYIFLWKLGIPWSDLIKIPNRSKFFNSEQKLISNFIIYHKNDSYRQLICAEKTRAQKSCSFLQPPYLREVSAIRCHQRPQRKRLNPNWMHRLSTTIICGLLSRLPTRKTTLFKNCGKFLLLYWPYVSHAGHFQNGT